LPSKPTSPKLYPKNPQPPKPCLPNPQQLKLRPMNHQSPSESTVAKASPSESSTTVTSQSETTIDKISPSNRQRRNFALQMQNYQNFALLVMSTISKRKRLPRSRPPPHPIVFSTTFKNVPSAAPRTSQRRRMLRLNPGLPLYSLQIYSPGLSRIFLMGWYD
jgi:hypothetical protein